jgi:hypothetical protein
MQRAAADPHWDDTDAVASHQLHPLRARLQRPPSRSATLVPQSAPAAPRIEITSPPAFVPPAVKAEPVLARRRAGSALAYGLLGFILGAIFWHFVGFWDFVGQVMFKGRPIETQITQAPPPIKLKERVSGVSALAVVIEPEACTTLQLDRVAGTTKAVSCEVESLPLRSLKTARREDLWVTAGQRMQEATARGWSAVTIEKRDTRQGQTAAAD